MPAFDPEETYAVRISLPHSGPSVSNTQVYPAASAATGAVATA